MNKGKTIFTQIMQFASPDIFKICVSRYNGNYRNRGFTCWKQYLCMVFGQLTHRESISDTLLCLSLNSSKLFHLGIGKVVNKSTLSRANESRDWQIYRDFALKLIEQAQKLYVNENNTSIRIKGKVFALDSTTVDLCLNAFWWATFRTTKAAIKIHTLLDVKSEIPDFIYISEGDVHDVNILDLIEIQPKSYYVMDKAYIDFERLYRIHREHAFFVIRAKNNMNCIRLSSKNADKSRGIICDQEIRLKGYKSRLCYPEKIRRIKFFDDEYSRTFVFITNNFHLSAYNIALLYKNRWQIEIFFKWIKQHLKIKSFWGNNENAVKTQIWIAISVYVTVAIAKKQLNLPYSLYEILQLISVSAFERIPLTEIFLSQNYQNVKEHNCIQLKMFEL